MPVEEKIPSPKIMRFALEKTRVLNVYPLKSDRNFLLDSGLRFFINKMILSKKYPQLSNKGCIKNFFAHLYQNMMESLRIGNIQRIGLGIPFNMEASGRSKSHTPSGPFTLATPPSMGGRLNKLQIKWRGIRQKTNRFP